MFKPNLVNIIATILMFISGLFLKFTPCWQIMRNRSINFKYCDFKLLLSKFNYFLPYPKNWQISYPLLFLSLILVYIISSLIYWKIKKSKNK